MHEILRRASAIELESGPPWVDISVPLHSAMVHWPGDPPFDSVRVKDMERGDAANLSDLRMGSHTGTHVDAPRHFLRDGPDVSMMPVDTMIGPARVVEIRDPRVVTAEELGRNEIRAGERILLKTRNSPGAWRRPGFVEDFVYISSEAADYLSRTGARLVGVDYLSVGAYQGNGAYVHRTLLGSGIWLIEGLDLGQVRAGRYDLVCLPLRIENGDGAPARAVLRPARPPGAAREELEYGDGLPGLA